jgi:hypothetical protein
MYLENTKGSALLDLSKSEQLIFLFVSNPCMLSKSQIDTEKYKEEINVIHHSTFQRQLP